MTELYLLGIGSNMYVGRNPPSTVVRLSMDILGKAADIRITARSGICMSRPIGPSRRTYANAAIAIETRLPPTELLKTLKNVEQQFGRRQGKRWGPRPLDLDVLLWSGGRWRSRELVIPHREMANRHFVLRPASEIAAGWRLPGSGLTVRHLAAKLRKPSCTNLLCPQTMTKFAGIAA